MKNSVIAELKVIPLGTKSASLSKYVVAVVKVVKQAKGVSYQVTPMATIVQGPLSKILKLAQEMHEVPFTMGANRVLTSISIDDRRDKQTTMAGKVKAVS
ncbi:MAG: MTH1187 family thiamine-binding protein [Dehalococcoidales bacterium]|nr:MTH1187 family thiamine-binding protein [Dehalococcoidales bacterium]